MKKNKIFKVITLIIVVCMALLSTLKPLKTKAISVTYDDNMIIQTLNERVAYNTRLGSSINSNQITSTANNYLFTYSNFIALNDIDKISWDISSTSTTECIVFLSLMQRTDLDINIRDLESIELWYGDYSDNKKINQFNLDNGNIYIYSNNNKVSYNITNFINSDNFVGYAVVVFPKINGAVWYDYTAFPVLIVYSQQAQSLIYYAYQECYYSPDIGGTTQDIGFLSSMIWKPNSGYNNNNWVNFVTYVNSGYNLATANENESFTPIQRTTLWNNFFNSYYKNLSTMFQLPLSAYNSEGYTSGFEKGNNEGYTSGFDAGQKIGYELGYENGVSDTENVTTNWIVQISKGIGAVLSLQILPNFPLGLIVAIPLVCGLIIMIIRIWKR